ncbi:MAG: DEAD/DEAH box helicase family protein, partial [Coriobacteriales bacterium]|nr:DEAD/DEAH box helicase family protein [Coriobacteriales bacterium]
SRTGLLGRIFKNYEERPNQKQMAKAVNKALSQGDHLICEAGTGVGKSLAYLVPAAYISQKNNIPICVATKSNNLLDQLMYEELPRLSKNLEKPLQYISLKGYEHYLCLRKLNSYLRRNKLSNGTIISNIASLLIFTLQSNWVDLDSYHSYWPAFLKQELVCDSIDCLKNHCPFYKYCFLHALRGSAQSANVIVTNHSLLFRDVESKSHGAENGLLPSISHWIIDEAHNIEDEARQQLSYCVGKDDLLNQLKRLNNSHNGALLTLSKKIANQSGNSLLKGMIAEAYAICTSLEELNNDFFNTVHIEFSLETQKKSDENYPNFKRLVDNSLKEQEMFKKIRDFGEPFLLKLAQLKERLNAIVSLGKDFENAR